MYQYEKKEILSQNPFDVLDLEGVGPLIHKAVKDAKASNPNVKIGVCGKHAADPASIDFFHREEFNHLSCGIYMIPIARLAAAQATIRNKD